MSSSESRKYVFKNSWNCIASIFFCEQGVQNLVKWRSDVSFLKLLKNFVKSKDFNFEVPENRKLGKSQWQDCFRSSNVRSKKLGNWQRQNSFEIQTSQKTCEMATRQIGFKTNDFRWSHTWSHEDFSSKWPLQNEFGDIKDSSKVFDRWISPRWLRKRTKTSGSGFGNQSPKRSANILTSIYHHGWMLRSK